MNALTSRRKFIATLPTLCCAGRLLAADSPPLVVKGDSDPSKFIPISLDGFTGEVMSALRFDLEIAGFEVTAAEQALLNVSGSNNSNVVARVTANYRVSIGAAGGTNANTASGGGRLLDKEYVGGSPRAQAHALADDIVALLGRQGVARTKIAFKVERGGNSEIYISDYDGRNPIQLTSDNTITRDPAWGPGRRMFYYTSYKAGNPDIYSHDLQNGVRRDFARYPGLNSGAAVSPDGRRVAMVLSKGGSPDVYVIDADGNNLRQLTHTKEAESSPCWSPGGQTICFSSRAEGRSALFIVPVQGGAMRKLQTGGAINCTEPDWSPDGKWIIFTRSAGGFELCVVPAGGGSATVLVTGEDPSWAPNSRTVAFTRRVGEKRVVSLLDVPTKRVKDIQQVPGNGSQACWAK